MTVWIVGGTGFLGRHLSEKFRQGNTDHLTTSREGIESDFSVNLLREESFCKIPIKSLDIVVFLAGVSSPESCENDFEAAHKVNVVGTAGFISFALERGAKVLFASSDTVYGEQVDVVDETVACEPVGKYASMKHAVEQVFQKEQAFVSFRLSYIEAPNDKFTNFLRESSGTKEEVAVFSDLVRNTISIDDVVEGLRLICEDWGRLEGHRVINFSGPVSESRVDLASRIIVRLGLDLKVRPVSAPEGFFSCRPRVIRLSNGRLSKLLTSKS